MYLIKASGNKELFNSNKLLETLKRIGIQPDKAQFIVDKITRSLSRKPTSTEVIKRTLWELKQEQPALAARYNLKRAIMNLGPTGFIFEKYISRILEAYGYQTQTNVHLEGFCVPHELDIVAKKNDQYIMIECKYHNIPGMHSDVKVALYTYARFLDIKKAWEQQPKHHQNNFQEVWLATNTKCTQDAIQYAKCVGLKILSWHYPEDNSLEKLIDQKQLYPLTVLLGGNRSIFAKLINVGYLLASDLARAEAKEVVRQTHLNYQQIYYLIEEAKALEKIRT